MAKSREAFRTISEVADWLDVQTHVLRFWESKFSQVKPVKRAGGRRYYRPQDMELLGGLKKLLHEDGMPIKDAQQLLREKGVKHVSSLSRPVDEEAPALESDSEDVTCEAVQEPTEAPQKEPQTDILQDESSEAQSVQQEPLEAVAEVFEDAPKAGLPLVDSDEVAFAASEENVEEAPEGSLYTAPDGSKPDVNAAGEDDDNIPEDLLVKIEDDVPVSTSETSPVPAGLTGSISTSEPALNTGEDALAASEQASNADAVAAAAPSDNLPPMADLFATLGKPDAPPQVSAEDVMPLASGDATISETFGEATSDSAAETAPVEAADEYVDPETNASETTLETDSKAPAEAGQLTSQDTSSDQSDTLNTPAADRKAPMVAVENNASASSDFMAPTPNAKRQAPAETATDASATATASSAPDLETVVTREAARDDFLLMLTKPVELEPKDASRAASLLARLEALHSKAG